MIICLLKEMFVALAALRTCTGLTFVVFYCAKEYAHNFRCFLIPLSFRHVKNHGKIINEKFNENQKIHLETEK